MERPSPRLPILIMTLWLPIGAQQILTSGRDHHAHRRHEPESELTICIENTFQAREAVGRAEVITTRIFADIGVRIRWRDSGNHCSSIEEQVIVISVTGYIPDNYLPGSLGSALPYEGVHIQVFHERIKNLFPGDTYVLLGHVFAHEIAHILQGTNQHSLSGMMREHWNAEDYAQMRLRLLRFTKIEIALIRRGFDTRFSRGAIGAVDRLAPPSTAAMSDCPPPGRSMRVIAYGDGVSRSINSGAALILAKYAGTYKELDIWNGGPIPRTIEITTPGGALFADLKGRGKVQLTAQSPTTFTGFFGLGIRFLVDGQGVVTHLAEMHVSGDYRFIRLK